MKLTEKTYPLRLPDKTFILVEKYAKKRNMPLSRWFREAIDAKLKDSRNKK